MPCQHHDACDHDVSEDQWDSGDSLFPCIALDQVRCLNEREPDSGKRILRPWCERMQIERRVQSEEDDDQLILHVPFTTQVQLKAIRMITGAQGSAPDTIALFSNRDDIDFSNAEELKPVQTLTVVEDHDASVEYQLKPAKFTNCSSLTLFIPKAKNANFCELQFLYLKGVNQKHKREAVTAVYEARAIPKDHAVRGDQFMPHTLG